MSRVIVKNKDCQIFSFSTKQLKIKSFTSGLETIKTGKKKKTIYIIINNKKEAICAERKD